MKAKAIATILALVFILTGFATVVPTTSASLPINVTASDVTSGSFTITWTTTFNEQGRLDWQQGIAAPPLGNTFTEAGASNLHNVKITGLSAGTPHSYTIWSEGVEYGDSDGDGDPSTGFPLAGALPWIVTTTSAAPSSGLVYGHVTNLAAGNAVGVTVIITDVGGTSYTGTTDANGNYLVNVYGYMGPADIEIEGAAQGMYTRTAIPGGITGNPYGPVDITLTQYTPGSLVMIPASPMVIANGSDIETFTVTVTDLFGSPIDTLGGGDFTITWLQHYSTDSTLVYTSNDGGGAYTFTYTSGLFAPGTDQPQITYAGVSDDSTIDVQLPLWYLHIDDQGGSELDLIMDTASDDAGPNSVSLDVTSASVDGMLGVWNTSIFVQNTDVGGTWMFSVDLYEEDDVIDGNVYAKIYSNGLLKHTTVNQSIGDVDNTVPGTSVLWTDTIPADTIISSGDNVSVEYWFDATDGGGGGGTAATKNILATPGTENLVFGTGGGNQIKMGPIDDNNPNVFTEAQEVSSQVIFLRDFDDAAMSSNWTSGWSNVRWNVLGTNDQYGNTTSYLPYDNRCILMYGTPSSIETKASLFNMAGYSNRKVSWMYDYQSIGTGLESSYTLFYDGSWRTPTTFGTTVDDGDFTTDSPSDWAQHIVDLETVVPAISNWGDVRIRFQSPPLNGVDDEVLFDNITFYAGGGMDYNRLNVSWEYNMELGAAPAVLWVDADYDSGDDGPAQIQISETGVWAGEEWTVATIPAGGSVNTNYSVVLNYTNPTYVRAYVPEGTGTDEQSLSIDRLYFETNNTGINYGQTIDIGWGSGGVNPTEMGPGDDGVSNDVTEEPEGTGSTILNAIGEQAYFGTPVNDYTATYFVPDDAVFEGLVEDVYAAPAPIIIDDAEPNVANFTETDFTSLSPAADGYGNDCHYKFGTSGSATAEWYPGITIPGNYLVEAYNNDILTYVSDAYYSVAHGRADRRGFASTSVYNVDQDTNVKGWTVTIGTFYFAGYVQENVKLFGNYTVGSALLCDALRFTYVDAGGVSALDHNWTFDTTPVTDNAVTLHIDYTIAAGVDDEYTVQYSGDSEGLPPFHENDILGYLKGGDNNNDRSFDLSSFNIQNDFDDTVSIRIFSNNTGDVQDTVNIDRIWLDWDSGGAITKNRLNATWVFDLAEIGGDPNIGVHYDVDSWSDGDDNLVFQWANGLAGPWTSFGSTITPDSTDVEVTADLSGQGVVFDSTFYIRAYVAEGTGSTTQTAQIDQLHIVTGGSSTPYKLNMGYDSTSDGMDGWIMMPQCPGGTPPTVSSTTPGNGATGVVESTSVEVVFDMAMDTGVTPVLTQTVGTDPGGWSFSGWTGGDTATWSHNDWLSEDSVTMEVAGAESSAGVPLAAPFSWSFTVQDHILPTIAETVPYSGDPDANETRDVYVNFTEAMNVGVQPTLVQTGGTPPAGGFVWAGWDDADTARWTHNDWDSEEAVTLQVDGAQDVNGRGMNMYEWSFVVHDRIDPTVVSETPADGSSDVPVDTMVVVVFDEPMDGFIPTLAQTTGTIVGGWIFQGWTVGGTTASWVHDDWSGGELITMQISDARDDSDNTMVLYEWDFNTLGGADVTPPDVTVVSPANSATDVGIGANIVVRFNEAMNASLEPTLTQTSGTDPGGWSFIGWDLGNTRATWTHNDWNPGDSITMEVVDFNDTSDNQQTTSYSWSFTIGYPDIQVMFHFETRWNMFSLNVFNTSDEIDASEIFSGISTAGGSAMVISYWEAGVGYRSYSGSPGDDFELEIGIGYWIFLDEGSGPADIPLYGLDRPSYETWDLAYGDTHPRGDGTADGKLTVPLTASEYNLLGWFNMTTPVVAELIDLIDDDYDAGARGFVLYWDNPGRAYGITAIQLSPGTITTQSWPIEPMKGYWSGINTATSVTY